MYRHNLFKLANSKRRVQEVYKSFRRFQKNGGKPPAPPTQVPTKPPPAKGGPIVAIEKFEKAELKNESVIEYKAGSKDVQELRKALEAACKSCEDIPIVINGKEIKTQDQKYQMMPHNHDQKIASYYLADKPLIEQAIEAATAAQKKWDCTSLADRIKIWEKGADLMSKKYRHKLVAATMLGQSKTVIQAEIDVGAELVDFMRMNCAFLKMLASYVPISTKENKNYYRYRGLEGFVAAIAPFNFSAISGNLAYTPALMGNGVVWKPSESAILSSWRIFEIMREAGVPDGVINFVPADGPTFGETITASPNLAGINFTGSVPTMQTLWKLVGKNVECYDTFPRIVGECGGKNFHFVHNSADIKSAIACTIRAAFEYGGQKCSACSVMFVPQSLWDCKIKNPLVDKTSRLQVGDVTDFRNFYGGLINEQAFQRVTSYITYAKECESCCLITGGCSDDARGYYVEPTIIQVNDLDDRLLKEEIFGPILAVHVYKDSKAEEILRYIADNSKFGLCGAVFAKEEEFLQEATQTLKYVAGNFYLNDKCTGAVVGQQPFGGSRLSGTNDKAGGPHYILRWTSPQSVKETTCAQTDILYPYMQECP